MGTAAGWWCPAQLVDVRPLTLRKMRSRQQDTPRRAGLRWGPPESSIKATGSSGEQGANPPSRGQSGRGRDGGHGCVESHCLQTWKHSCGLDKEDNVKLVRKEVLSFPALRRCVFLSAVLTVHSWWREQSPGFHAGTGTLRSWSR